MFDPQKTVILDLDGTLIERTWPDLGKFKPGAVKAMHVLHNAGLTLRVFSCRLSPVTPYEHPRPAHEVATEIQKVRALLDNSGLTFVDIYTGPGKPPGMVYVDDKAERYGGGAKSWDKMTEKILMRVLPGDESYEWRIWSEYEQEGVGSGD